MTMLQVLLVFVGCLCVGFLTSMFMGAKLLGISVKTWWGLLLSK